MAAGPGAHLRSRPDHADHLGDRTSGRGDQMKSNRRARPGATPAARAAMRAGLARLVERTSDTVVVIDANGTIRWVNAATEELVGHDRSATIGTPVLDLVHPDDAARATAGLARITTEETLTPIRVRIRSGDGGWRPVEVTATNLVDDPSVRGIALIGRDLSERRRLERRVHDLEHNFTAAFRHSPVGRTLSSPPSPGLLVTHPFP